MSGRNRLPNVLAFVGLALGCSQGFKPVPPRTDPKTGFVVGGTNSTELILGLQEINGRTIAELEDDMRPGSSAGHRSEKGFLGPDEKLLKVMADDNRYVVDECGLTHQELARHLHVAASLAEKGEFRYQGRRFKSGVIYFGGKQLSPFLDDTSTSREVTVKNQDNGKKLHYSCLVPHMIQRYGFYEGKGTPFRVEPREVIELFDFLQDKLKKP